MDHTFIEFLGQHHSGLEIDADEPLLVQRFADLPVEYRALRQGLAIVPRLDRGLLVATGADRAAWLHNLVTNEVRNLGRFEGNHAFSVNVQGRILFALNVLMREEEIWIDLDRLDLATALTHFEKYHITEDVALTDRSADVVRMALAGPQLDAWLAARSWPSLSTLPDLSQRMVDVQGAPCVLLRHDFCGVPGVELFVPADRAPETWSYLCQPADPCPVPAGGQAVDVVRIEAGLPWPGREITSEYLPAETGQFDRTVSFRKGCYLGQEVVERMRSRSVVARKLCGFVSDNRAALPPAAVLLDTEGASVGQLTSSCHSMALDRPIALGYVRTALAEPGTALSARHAEDQPISVTVTALPFVPGPVS